MLSARGRWSSLAHASTTKETMKPDFSISQRWEPSTAPGSESKNAGKSASITQNNVTSRVPSSFPTGDAWRRASLFPAYVDDYSQSALRHDTGCLLTRGFGVRRGEAMLNQFNPQNSVPLGGERRPHFLLLCLQLGKRQKQTLGLFLRNHFLLRGTAQTRPLHCEYKSPFGLNCVYETKFLLSLHSTGSLDACLQSRPASVIVSFWGEKKIPFPLNIPSLDINLS